MVERVRWQLDAWIGLPVGSEHELTGGIALVRLRADEVRADDGVQLGLWGGQSDADRHAARTIARLATLTSDDAVTVPVWRGGRLPVDRYEWVPASTVDLDQRVVGPGGGSGPWPGALPSPSPATVLTEPQPIEVFDRDGRPVRVGGRGEVSAAPAVLHLVMGGAGGEPGSASGVTSGSVVESAGGRRLGRARTVTAWAGPWPVEQRWWEPDHRRRLARFQVVTDGRDGLLVAAEHRRWWLLARYD
jgi:protein ImuB